MFTKNSYIIVYINIKKHKICVIDISSGIKGVFFLPLLLFYFIFPPPLLQYDYLNNHSMYHLYNKKKEIK